MGWIETWMNDPKVKAAVGADSSIKFASCNLQVNQAFLMQGDGMHNSAPLLTDLVNDGIRLLIYAGNADYMCNFIVSQCVSSRLVSSVERCLSCCAGKRSVAPRIREQVPRGVPLR